MDILIRPLGIIKTRRPEFWTFVVANAFFAQIGILGALLLTPAFGMGNFAPLLGAQLRGANLFVFGISLLVTACVPLLLEYARAREFHFRELKLLTGSICLALIVVEAIGTGMVLSKGIVTSQTPIGQQDLLDLLAEHWLQVLCYGMSIAVAMYVFCVTQLHHDLDNYAHLDDRERDALVEETGSQKAAADGLQLD